MHSEHWGLGPQNGPGPFVWKLPITFWKVYWYADLLNICIHDIIKNNNFDFHEIDEMMSALCRISQEQRGLIFVKVAT